jgi:hypothetical protein
MKYLLALLLLVAWFIIGPFVIAPLTAYAWWSAVLWSLGIVLLFAGIIYWNERSE